MTGILSLHSSFTIQTWDLENNDGGFISIGDLQWEWGAVGGPLSSHDGSNAWATILGGDYNDSVGIYNYPAPVGARAPLLSFVQWVDIDSEGDIGGIEGVSDLEHTGPCLWLSLRRRLYRQQRRRSRYLWTSKRMISQVRLHFASDPIVARSGWVVDDFKLWDGDPVPPYIQSVSTVADSQNLETGPEIQAIILEDFGTLTATVEWESDDGQTGSIELLQSSSDEWSSTMPVFAPDTSLPGECRLPTANHEYGGPGSIGFIFPRRPN